MNSAFTVPLFLRGELITDDLVPFGTRTGESQFHAPDMARYVDRLPLATPMAMSDLNDLAFDEILDVLQALGDALDFDRNTHLQEAYEAALSANPLPGGDAEEQLPDPAAAVLARQRSRGRRHPGRARLSQRLGAADSWPMDANYGCARSAPGSCTSRRATEVLFRR